MSETELTTINALENIQQLSLMEQAVVYLKALLALPCNRNLFFLLWSFEPIEPEGQFLDDKKLHEMDQILISLKIVTEVNSMVVFHPSYCHQLSVLAKQHPHYDQLKSMHKIAIEYAEYFYTPNQKPRLSADSPSEYYNINSLAILSYKQAIYHENAALKDPKIKNQLNKVCEYLFEDADIDITWLKSQHDCYQKAIFTIKLAHAIKTGIVTAAFKEIINYYFDSANLLSWEGLPERLLAYFSLAGDKKALEQLLPHLKEHNQLKAKAILAIIDEQFSQATQLYTASLNYSKKQFKYSEPPWDNHHYAYFAMACLADNTKESLSKLRQKLPSSPYEAPSNMLSELNALKALAVMQEDSIEHARSVLYHKPTPTMPSALTRPLTLWTQWVLDKKALKTTHDECVHLFKRYQQNFPLIAGLLAEILANSAENKLFYHHYLQQNKLPNWYNHLVPHKPWQDIKLELEKQAGQLTQQKQLSWHLDPVKLNLSVSEKVQLKSHRWSKGRTLSNKQLYELNHQPWLTQSDRDAIKCLHKELSDDELEPIYTWDWPALLKVLSQHQQLFLLENPKQPISLIEGEPQLMIEPQGADFHLYCLPYQDQPGVYIEKETPQQHRWYHFTPQIALAAENLGPKGVVAPENTKNDLLQLLQSAAPELKAQMLQDKDNVKWINADPSCKLQLVPKKAGLKIYAIVRPLGEQGPYYLPTLGPKVVQTIVDDETLSTVRDMDDEYQQTIKVLNTVNCLTIDEDNSYSWELESPQTCLELLDTLGANPNIIVEWPQGQNFKLKRVGKKQLSINLQEKAGWFEVEGEVEVDEDHVLSVRHLLNLLNQSQSRFIALDNGQFIALSDSLKSELKQLACVAPTGKLAPQASHLQARRVAHY